MPPAQGQPGSPCRGAHQHGRARLEHLPPDRLQQKAARAGGGEAVDADAAAEIDHAPPGRARLKDVVHLDRGD